MNKELEENWKRILDVREEVYRALEKARNEKMIGNSLEAEVTIFSTSPEKTRFLKKYQSELATIFIVSRVEVSDVSEDLPEGILPGEEIKELGVGVKKASGDKCRRCWVYSETVGKSEEHPDICSRCVEVVHTL